jgi:hypothetical protein
LSANTEPEDLDDADQDDEVEDADHDEEHAGDGRSDQPGRLVQRGAVVGDRAAEALDADGEQRGEREDDRGVPEREEAPDAQRPLAVDHELARGVVDRADVIGVKGVTHPEGVGGDADADPERAARAEAEMGRDDEAEQQAEADHVQPEDHDPEHGGASPFHGREGALDLLPARHA